MTKKKGMFLKLVLWITSLLIALAVGFAFIAGSLTLPFIPLVIMQVLGWIIVAGAFVSFFSVFMK